MQTKRSREHSVSKAYLCNVVLGRAAHTSDTGNAFGPSIEIALSVANYRRLTRSTAGCVYSDKIGFRNGEKAKGIVVPHILLRYKREPLQIVERFNILGLDACLVHLFSIGLDLLVNAGYRFLKPFELYFSYFFTRKSFFF